MSLRANMVPRGTKVIAIVAGTLLMACSTSVLPASSQRRSIIELEHCIGEVVPLCTTLRIAETGTAEYVQRRRRTLTARLGRRELDELRAHSTMIDITQFVGDDRPVGPYITVHLQSGIRTFPLDEVPSEIRPLLSSIDRAGRKLFGRSYVTIAEGVDESRM